MTRILALVLAVVLSGCTAISTALTPSPYVPFTVEILNFPIYEADLAQCQAYAAAYQHHLSPRGIATATVSGGLQNGPAAVVNPIATGIGAAAAGTNEVLTDLNLNGADAQRITALCMKSKGDESHLYRVVDPRL